MGIFAKKTVCQYCDTIMDSINRNKRFCSAKCRVYFNRAKNSKTISQNTTEVIRSPTPIVKIKEKIEDIENTPTSARIPKPVIKYVQERLELTDPEDYAKWLEIK